MHRLVWLVMLLALAVCGGGKSAAPLSVTCSWGTELYGAASIDVSGDLVDGRPTMTFPDPANSGGLFITGLKVYPGNDGNADEASDTTVA